VERIDPATGRAEWSYRVPGSARPDVSLLSAEPALISSGKRLLTLDQGRVRTRIGLADRATGRGLPAGGKLYLPHGELAGAGTAKGQPTGPRGSTRIVEIDLRDGKRRSLDSGEKGELRLVSVDGKQLIATRVYRADGTTGSGSSRRKSSEYRRSLVAVDRSDGGMKKLFDLKSDNEVFKESDAYFDQGRLILSNTGLWTGSVKPMWTAMAYTAP
jgi:hypothetical protein